MKWKVVHGPSETPTISRDELYKDRSSRKTDSQKEKRSSGNHILLNILVSENWFSGKTFFYTIASSAFADEIVVTVEEEEDPDLSGISGQEQQEEQNRDSVLDLEFGIWSLSLLAR